MSCFNDTCFQAGIVEASFVAFFAIAAFMIAASGVLIDLWNRSVAGSDDDDDENYYVKMLRNEPWKFERQMVVFYGSGEGDYFSIPLPYGYNAMYHMGVQSSAAAFGDVDPLDAISKATRVAFDAFNPIGSGGSWLCSRSVAWTRRRRCSRAT